MYSKILLSPSIGLANPRSWQALPELSLHHQQRIDEVHCIGGGTLLLWLLIRAKRIPRVGHVVVHGPIVLPTAESCEQWVSSIDPEAAPKEREWRREALCLGLGGALSATNKEWLAPILHTIASGRSEELALEMLRYRDRWADVGRLSDELSYVDMDMACSDDAQWCLLPPDPLLLA